LEVDFQISGRDFDDLVLLLLSGSLGLRRWHITYVIIGPDGSVVCMNADALMFSKPSTSGGTVGQDEVNLSSGSGP
jgi:hypothetical protein